MYCNDVIPAALLDSEVGGNVGTEVGTGVGTGVVSVVSVALQTPVVNSVTLKHPEKCTRNEEIFTQRRTKLHNI